MPTAFPDEYWENINRKTTTYSKQGYYNQKANFLGLTMLCLTTTVNQICTNIDLILVRHPLLDGAVDRLVAAVSVASVISRVLPG